MSGTGIKINSEKLTVLINYAGAEISSVKNNDGIEFMWQAKKEVWPRHAPVLFPIVGKLKNDTYIYNGTEYKLSQHGFARDHQFELTEHTKSSCTFQLTSNADTKKNYPFDFIFQIKYQLLGNELVTTYKTTNTSSGALLFSVGAHPGFNVPLLPTEKFEDYHLEFETTALALTELQNGLRLKDKKPLKLDGNRLQITKTLFDNDALVFENSQINSITLRSEKSSHTIKFVCKNWPYFGIWSKKSNREFICLEPWYGIADNVGSSQKLTEKDGMIRLEPVSDFSCSYSILFN